VGQAAGTRRRAPAVTNGSVYCIKYASDRSLDLDRVGRTLLSAAFEVGVAFDFPRIRECKSGQECPLYTGFVEKR
jgi:hypothetical protein